MHPLQKLLGSAKLSAQREEPQPKQQIGFDVETGREYTVDVETGLEIALAPGNRHLLSVASRAASEAAAAQANAPTLAAPRAAPAQPTLVTVDWLPQNLDRVSIMNWKTNEVLVRTYPFIDNLNLICGSRFKHLEGFRGLLARPNKVDHLIPGLHDEATNAVNSIRKLNSLPSIRTLSRCFIYSTVSHQGTQCHIVDFGRIFPSQTPSQKSVVCAIPLHDACLVS